jgi:hypothetical protein
MIYNKNMRSICPICSNGECEQLFSLQISQISDSTMDGNLRIMNCKTCSFYFTQSKSTESDYYNYYLTQNNYSLENCRWTTLCTDKDRQTYDFLLKNLDSSVKSILDYGSGGCGLSKLLSSNYSVSTYDVGNDLPKGNSDCLVLSHVLEHIYNPVEFIRMISSYVRNDGFIYIEIPNANCYEKMQSFGSLQEINFEHINFFSPYSLSKIMIQSGYTPVLVTQGSFILSENNYQVIRAIFQKNSNTTSVEQYINEGVNNIEKIKRSLPDLTGRVFVYGCGQFLYKIISYLQEKYTIQAIIDDNPNFKNKTLNTLNILPFSSVKDTLTSSDTVLITVGSVYTKMIEQRLKENCSGLNIVTI